MFTRFQLAVSQCKSQCNVNEIINIVSPHISSASPYVGLFVGVGFGVWWNVPKTNLDIYDMVKDKTKFALVGATSTILTGIIGLVMHRQITQTMIPCAMIFVPIYNAYLMYASRYPPLDKR